MAKLEKIEALLARAAPPDENVAFLADLLSLPAAERHPLPNLTSQRKTVELDGRIVLRVPHGRRTLARCVADRLRRAKCVTLHPRHGCPSGKLREARLRSDRVRRMPRRVLFI